MASLVIASVAVIVGVEVFGLALATAWATGGLLGLHWAVSVAIGVALAALGAYVFVPFIRRVVEVERAEARGDVETNESERVGSRSQTAEEGGRGE
ncbi:hypothetical protein ACTZWW_19380 [Salinarimonas sp. NSM]|uniref:hypothetical protein n=1 Tax=Salinarimonas sp. NSM TaxID=3458003 RepID=UPI004035178F